VKIVLAACVFGAVLCAGLVFGLGTFPTNSKKSDSKTAKQTEVEDPAESQEQIAFKKQLELQVRIDAKKAAAEAKEKAEAKVQEEARKEHARIEAKARADAQKAKAQAEAQKAREIAKAQAEAKEQAEAPAKELAKAQAEAREHWLDDYNRRMNDFRDQFYGFNTPDGRIAIKQNAVTYASGRLDALEKNDKVYGPERLALAATARSHAAAIIQRMTDAIIEEQRLLLLRR
jgi:hypothetical protein